MIDIVRNIGRRFCVDGDLVACSKIGLGHINDTYAVTYASPCGRQERFVHQRINHNVFKDPVGLMSNIERVLSHLHARRDNSADTEVLKLVPARDGSLWWRDDGGYIWRTYVFVEGDCYCKIENPEPVRIAAAAFGQFQADLMNLPAPRLKETIPRFHDTPMRFEHFEKALSEDKKNRAASVRAEISFAEERKDMAGVVQSLLDNGGIPERTVHNDAKLNNVLINAALGNRACVIDLDTVMPGTALFDFGDLIRTMISPGAEDEKDLTRIGVQMRLFETVAEGYLSKAGRFLTGTEKDYLVFAGKLITFETGLRFLTDYLAGDVYFKIHRPDHNLDRCRTQFQLVRSIEENEDRMRKIVRDLG